MSDHQEVERKIGNVVEQVIEEEMQHSYLDYAMSVIVGRALPDVRDGLKPVHRRILYGMYDMGLTHNKPFKKSARIVGDVLGKYHPHGDSAVYDAMVRMVQDFSLRYPLVEGQGNFGSVDGDSAAAMRYTEARLTKLAEELLADIDKDTVDFVPNFDGSLKEPSVLPCRIPHLLVNGSSGIAVGMATNIPPHNMTEVVNAAIALIDNPSISPQELINHVTAPDFPTGGILCGLSTIHQAYLTGKGKYRLRGRAEIEEGKKQRIIIKELPYMVNKAQLLEHIANLVNEKTIVGISDLRDESDRNGMHVVIELKQDANAQVILNQLYKHTRLEVSQGITFLSLVNNQPKVLPLKAMLEHFIWHRKDVVTRRCTFELNKAKDRAHILEGLTKALDNIDAIVKDIKASKDTQSAINTLVTTYDLTQVQAKAILDMKLQKLSSLEQERIREEHKQILETIAHLTHILSSDENIYAVVRKELEEIKEKYGDERRTTINLEEDTDIDIEDLIEDEPVVITISHQGYIKRVAADTYKTQSRGGKGIIATTSKEEDFTEHLFIASTHDYLLLFTDKGKVHWVKVYQIPEGSRQAKGKAIINLIPLEKGEKVCAYEAVRDFKEDHYLFFATRQGVVKKTSLADFSRPRKGGIRALTLREGDKLVGVCQTDGNHQIILATAHGMAIRFEENAVRAMGRSAAGVRGITLKGDDYVIGMVVGDDTKSLLTITENGYGKRTKQSEYRLTNRGGVGVKNIICSQRNGKVVSVRSVSDEDEVMFISRNGIIIRTQVSGIPCIGRSTQGVRLMRLKGDDKVIDAAKIEQ
ncbi:DNA gyrase subunit A [Candidatus Woesearchaeota archaeon]|nr:MAG: DNA gyrase subunit A [Candidatus Woesearchaeota archaeon]